MKKNFTFLAALFAFAAATFTSCLKQDELAVPAGYDDFTAYLFENSYGTRSAYTESEMKVSDMNIYVYDARGDLYRQIYTDAIYTTKVRLALDSTYTILALANVGEIAPELHLEDMVSKTLLPWTGAAAMNEKGEPFACRFEFTAVKDAILYIDLERLVARYDFALDQTDMVGKFTVKSLRLCQANDTLVPFVEDSPRTVASSVIAVADSATADDLKKINAGGRRSFHVSENRQGVLLPDNTDPWAKVPDNIPGKKDVCTYLEMRGDYNDEGIKITDMGFRLYLGNDATTDFDIARNTAYTVTAGINDEATAELLSWKVVPGTVDDKRKLSWSPNPDTLFCEKTLDVTPTLETSANSSTTLDFSFEGLDGLGVTYTRSGNSLHFSSSKQLSELKKFYVTASTPDGRHSSKLTVVVQPRYPVKLVASCPSCGGTGDWVWDFYKIGGNVSYTVTATYNDNSSRPLSASEYTVSGNTRADLVDFTTNGTVRCAGSTDVGGDGSVKFSYSEAGKSVSLTKTWYKIYVTKIAPVVGNIYYNDSYTVSKISLTYSYGTGEEIAWPSGLGYINAQSDIYISVADKSCIITGKKSGTTTVNSSGTYRGVKMSGSIRSYAHMGIALTASGTTYTPLSGDIYASSVTFYCVAIDCDGYHNVSGTMRFNPSSGASSDFSGTSVSGKAVSDEISWRSQPEQQYLQMFGGKSSEFPSGMIDSDSRYVSSVTFHKATNEP